MARQPYFHAATYNPHFQLQDCKNLGVYNTSQQATKTSQFVQHNHIRNGGRGVLMRMTTAHGDQVLDAWTDFGSDSDVNF